MVDTSFRIILTILFCIFACDTSKFVYGKPGLCDVETGQSSSSIIIDIQESRGDQKNQTTFPSTLPIVGDTDSEIALNLVFPKGESLFTLRGKSLKLTAPLDRDAENLSHIVFQVTCSIKGTQKRRSYPVIVRVSDINDNVPTFINAPYETTIPELTPIGSTIFKNLKAVDADAGVNGLVEYFITPGSPEDLEVQYGDGKRRISVADGYGYFSINLPHQGQVTVNRTLDYERNQRYLLRIVASDRARNQSERLSSTTTLTVNIQDSDDQDPSFIYQGCTLQDGACINPQYHATVSSGMVAGVLTLLPEKIEAIDMDSINSPIAYSFVSGTPSSYRNYFEINEKTGVVKQIRPVDVAFTKQFDIIVKAEEVSENRRYTTAKLIITVKPVDVNPPVIHASAIEGFLDENSPIGSKVVDSSGKAIQLTVTDADIGAEDIKPKYIFELTTPSFTITDDGYLVANQDNLDRDPPSPGRFRFQVVAREKGGNAASAPLSLVVSLNDINDNAPRLPMIQPITIQAGDGRRQVVKVDAFDNDFGDNAVITYSIYHVSNAGLSKFTINPKTGLIETTGKLVAGEQYSITVQATDKGGKYSQTIVEVIVVPGPNTRSPVFQQSVYEATVNEGVPINTTVLIVNAMDPEGGPVTYSIVSGNDLNEFGIDEKTGAISVVRKLDREQLTQYQLMIKADDEDGLSSSVMVNIKVSDINDKNPEFINLPYEFKVEEGIDNAAVGQVKAIDGDEGQNAVIYYSLPPDVPFIIDVNTGDIRTSMQLDYEKQQDYKFVVTARDGGTEPRLATATVSVEIIDVEDELPLFHHTTYEATVPENSPGYTVTQVKADDADTTKKVTYVIKQGPTDLFTIDPNTGIIKTIRGLDYEKDTQHSLIIGTLENNSNLPGATTKVVINVQDVNDLPPVFLTVPGPIELNDDTPIGKKVTSLIATDSDGTSPSNKVRYELVGRGKAMRYFQIDPDLGTLQVKDDLRKEIDNEYQVDVKAYDLGDPQLSSVTSLAIFIRHTATVRPDAGIGFADDSFTVQILENATVNDLVKTFTVVNTAAHNNIPIRCTIVSGNGENIFSINVTADKNCELRIKEAKLDHEHEEQYRLKIRLDTLAGLVNPARSVAMVTIQVIDVNDNKPKFIYPETSKRFAKYAYYGAIARDKEVGSQVLHVKAVDLDSGKYGQVEFRLIQDEADDKGYFTIDSTTGMIKTARTLDDVEDKDLPFRLMVEAKDNPSFPLKESNSEVAHVVINLIEDRHRMILVINDARPNQVKMEENKIIGVLEEHSRLIVGVEKITARQYRSIDNITTESDPNSTDLWFYTIDPATELILDRNNTRVTRSILEADAVTNITSDVSDNLQVTASSIHAPLTVITPHTAIVAIQWEVFPYALILIAGLILILGLVGIIYICISWARYKAYKERMARLYVTPRYDPVFVEPNLKEYETQVLQMSVPVDDSDSYNDLQIDFSRKNHTFNLDNVGYISKSNGNISPSSSDTATTTRASSVAERNNSINNNNNHCNGTLGHTNRAYLRSSEEDITNLNSSRTNENVTFREKRNYTHGGFNYTIDRSPVETTTEL